MDGGIDMVYSLHFGWDLQKRLQELLHKQYSGELPVGCAVVLPVYPPDHDFSKTPLSESVNEGRPIRHLVSAPTMRIPTNISRTVNSYLAFRAVLRSVLEYNRGASSKDKIHRVLCPGLGTAVGRMPYSRSAVQMRTAYDAVLYGNVEAINSPSSLGDCCTSHTSLCQAGKGGETAFRPTAEGGELFVD
jgi:O-acetyl-ADP-ribose deacetylase (regulator of RNase III)